MPHGVEGRGRFGGFLLWGTLGCAVVGALVFFSTYGSQAWWDSRISHAERTDALDELLSIADFSYLDSGTRGRAARAAGNLARVTALRRAEVEARFVRLRDAAENEEDAGIYKSGLTRLNGDLVDAHYRRLLRRIEHLILWEGLKSRSSFDGLYERPLARAQKVDVLLETNEATIRAVRDGVTKDPCRDNPCDAAEARTVALEQYQGFVSIPGFEGLSAAKVNDALAGAHRIGVVLRWTRSVGRYEMCASGDANQEMAELFTIDLSTDTVLGATHIEGPAPPQQIAASPGDDHCGASGGPPDLAGWFVERRLAAPPQTDKTASE